MILATIAFIGASVAVAAFLGKILFAEHQNHQGSLQPIRIKSDEKRPVKRRR
ncbi:MULTISPECIES: hypothetical protein [Neptunomonas]|uniref:hypothetical protein n=1 Tax=Neptunomonas TaxID=75687 RepID=UPI0015BE8DC2|nr:MULTISPECIES: hypothetical protein [Neptunomonas]MDN2661514.1 hypothetical protein [Neptunomonas sp. CHC150]MDO6467802.1 hypothetical protein [Neptunomonas phycophila]